jgi:methanogenic corrinoid protein MtbC1
MLTFDQFKFETTYNKLLSEMSFSEMFLEIFIPLLDYIGLQWLSDSITPSHEHFITSLIMQKLLINIERVNITRPEKKNIYVLFLPENEIHELGLLYANYVLLKEGYQTIYLGPSVPIDSLESIISCYSNVSFVSYFTVAPTKLEVNTYLEEMNHKILSKYKLNLNILGRNAQEATFKSPYLKVFNKIDNLLNKTIL